SKIFFFFKQDHFLGILPEICGFREMYQKQSILHPHKTLPASKMDQRANPRPKMLVYFSTNVHNWIFGPKLMIIPDHSFKIAMTHRDPSFWTDPNKWIPPC